MNNFNQKNKPIKRRLYILLFCFCQTAMLCGQEQSLSVNHCPESILVDGLLTEPAWSTAMLADEFQMNFPFDSLKAVSKTEVRMMYDEKYLYISAICHHRSNKDYVVQSLKRDFKFKENDAFGIFINAYNDETNGLYFGVNPFGVQSDGIVDNGGIKGVKPNWDGLWISEVNHSPNFWTVEIAIPFKTLRFKDQQKEWRINFARNDRTQNEISTWSPVPRAYKISTLSRTGTLKWGSAPMVPIGNVSVIPYFSVSTNRDFNNPSLSHKIKNTYGIDVKLAVNSSLNLDLTLNPDFSQVEVDQQVIDLQRFEIFFPEKRLLFLENSDLFSNIGNSRIRPFFSRRIGNTDNSPVPILFGARLSGNLDNNWRVGVMSIQTRSDNELDVRSKNYSVASIQRKMFNSSNLTGFFINRQSFQEFYSYQKDFNRIAGIEYDLRSKDSKWNGKAFYHHAFTPFKNTHTNAYSVKLRYRTTKATLFLGSDHAGKNFITETGFVPRLYHTNESTDSTIRVGYTHLRANGHYRFFAKKNSRIDFWGPTFHSDYFIGSEEKYQEHRNEITLLLRLKNTSSFEVVFVDGAPNLIFPFTLDGLKNSFPSGNYPNQQFSLVYNTGNRNRFYGSLEAGYGGVFLGDQLSFKTEWNYRCKHYAVFGLNMSHEELIHFPESYGNASFTLVGSKFEISFNRNLFFTTFVQYNTQSNNFNINSKFNWRFQPMSDLFLVYTENYTSQDLSVKNRALVLKMSYWIGGK